MKSSPLVIIIPLIIAALIVGSVFVVRYMSPQPLESRAAAQPTPASFPKLQVPTGVPEVGFGQLQPVAPVSDLRVSLENVQDDGMGEFDSLASEAAQL